VIDDRDQKMRETVKAIKNDLVGAYLFGTGTKLYLYRRLLDARAACPSIETFLMDDDNIRMLRATLEAWDMNTRGARMKSFGEFKASLLRCVGELNALEGLGAVRRLSPELRHRLKAAYDRLHVMRSRAKFVANAKWFSRQVIRV